MHAHQSILRTTVGLPHYDLLCLYIISSVFSVYGYSMGRVFGVTVVVRLDDFNHCERFTCFMSETKTIFGLPLYPIHRHTQAMLCMKFSNILISGDAYFFTNVKF